MQTCLKSQLRKNNLYFQLSKSEAFFNFNPSFPIITDNPTWPLSKKINSYHLIETMIIYENSHKQKLAKEATSKNPSDKNLINQMKYYENTWLQKNVGLWDQEEAPNQGSQSQFQKKVRIFQELMVYFILWKTILSS